MYGLNRLNNLRTLFTAAAHPKQLSRRSPPVRSIPFLHASPPASTAGIGYFVGVGEGRRINDDCFKRKLLPPELSRNVVTLTCGSSARGGICDVYVVGTNHGTAESCQEVQAVMEFLKPQVVFLELCSSRQHLLLPHNSKRKETDNADVMGLLLGEVIKNTPTFMETFVHERDQYMSTSLLKVAREHNSVVAVVGKGHLPGIRKNWKQPIEVEPLLIIPSENKLIRAISIGAAAAGVSGVAIISGVVFVYLIYLFI